MNKTRVLYCPWQEPAYVIQRSSSEFVDWQTMGAKYGRDDAVAAAQALLAGDAIIAEFEASDEAGSR